MGAFRGLGNISYGRQPHLVKFAIKKTAPLRGCFKGIFLLNFALVVCIEHVWVEYTIAHVYGAGCV
jgi:hypothetical protein